MLLRFGILAAALVLSVLAGVSCTPSASTIKPAFDESLLQKTWWHSYQESNPAGDVYRPEGYTLQPLRGRTGMTFGSDGKYTYIGIAPADGPLPFNGTWRWAGERVLRLSVEGKSYQGATWQAEEYDLEIISLTSDMLVAKRR